MSCTNCNGDCPLDLREKAVICAMCPDNETSFIDGVKVSLCSIDGVEIQDRKSCPRDKFKDGTGLTKFAGIVVYRVPRLTRWAAWLIMPEHPRPSRWRACGCFKALRDRWPRLSSDSKQPSRRSSPNQ